MSRKKKKMNKAKSKRPLEPSRQSMEKRIEELKQRAFELSGGEMISGGFSDNPLEVQLRFWENVVAIEESPEHRPFDILIESEEHQQIHLQYYADEMERAQWAEDWPDDELPDPKPLPYDRDRRLLRPHYLRNLATH